jgi:hypothetical protein
MYQKEVVKKGRLTLCPTLLGCCWQEMIPTFGDGRRVTFSALPDFLEERREKRRKEEVQVPVSVIVVQSKAKLS